MKSATPQDLMQAQQIGDGTPVGCRVEQAIFPSRALVPSVVPTLLHGHDCIKRARLEE